MVQRTMLLPDPGIAMEFCLKTVARGLIGLLAATSLSSSRAAEIDHDRLELTEKQLAAIKVEAARMMDFRVEERAVGAIDFNEDLSVQVFPPYQGKIIETFAKLGDEVKKGQKLFTIHSPDLIAAEGNLISAAASFELTSRGLERAREVHSVQGLADKDLEQSVSDQQTAEGALKAARDAVAVFGKTPADIDRIIRERRIDPALIVTSPINGRITARFAQPGLFVQPGNAPAPFTVSDLSVLWMIANIAESGTPRIRTGQPVTVAVLALPGRTFPATLTRLATSVDPTLHTLAARAEIEDPSHELRPGMIANFRIQVAAPQKSVGVPVNAVVREGDGTMTVWITSDRRHFDRRLVKTGLLQDGQRQILEGLNPGELLVTDGAVQLSNKAAGVGAI